MKDIAISSKAIPASPRSKNYPAGTSVLRTGGGGSTVTQPSVGSDVLSKDIIVTAPKTGYFDTGNIIAAGQTWEEVVRKMLYQPSPASLQGSLSTSNDVEFGSNKGIITYTSARNGQGPMKKAFFDNDEKNILVFSGNANGIQTAVRQLSGVYTQAESYFATVVYEANGELLEVTLNNKISVNVRRKWFAGVCDSVPSSSADVRALSANGLYTGTGSYKFSVGNWKKIAICVPENSISDIGVTAYPGNFVEDKGICSGPKTISVEGANASEASNYKMWVISAETMNDSDTFTFKTN